MRKLMMGVCGFAVVCIAFAKGPVIEETVFQKGALPEGWSADESCIISPVYSNYVSHISLAYGEELSGVYGTLSLFATDFTAHAESKIADLNTHTSAAQFDFPDGTDFRSFRIATNGVALSSFTAVWMDTRLSTPTNIAIANNTGSSFDISWDPVEDATGYRISVWTNKLVGAADGIVEWRETFQRMDSSKTAGLTEARLAKADNEGWATTDFFNGYLLDNGNGIRLGTSTATGYIAIPHVVAAGENALRVTAARYSQDKGQQLAVLCVLNGGATTNLVGTFPVDFNGMYPSFDGADDVIELPGSAAGGRIILQTVSGSDGKEARIAVKGIEFVSGYAAGTAIRDVVREETVPANGGSYTFSDLPPVAVQVSVEAVAAKPADSSGASEAVVVDLANPPPMPQLAVPGSLVSGEGYRETFDAFTNMTSSSVTYEWVDGLTLPFWQVRKGTAAVDGIKVKSGSSAKPTGGCYAYHAQNSADKDSYSLAAVSNGTSDNNIFRFGFAVTNDSEDVVLNGFSLEFTARQWTFAGSASNRSSAQAMHLEWLVTNEVVSVAADGDWMEVESARFDAVYSLEEAGVNADNDTGSARRIFNLGLEGVALQPGEVLMLRWRQDRVSGGEALGVDDVVLNCSRQLGGFTLHFVRR